MVLARAAVVALAILACAWFFLGIRQAKDIAHATSIVSSASKLTPAQAARARSLLHDAGRLDPDNEIDILRAEVALGLGEHRQAEQILAGVTRREPDNIEAWLWITKGATNSHTFYTGLAHIALLEPKVG